MKAYAAQTRRPMTDRDRLITDHMDIARRISMRVARRCPEWVSREDLIAAGMLGLTQAADRYDPARQEPFLAYAEKRIRGAVLDELRRGDIMPRRVRALTRKVGQAIKALEREHGRAPTDEEVATALEVSVDEYQTNLEQLVHVTVGALEQGAGANLPSDDLTPEAIAGWREGLVRVRAALARLERRDLIVLSLYYNEELTYAEIGHVLGVTVSRVCQLHGRAIARLRAEVEDPTGIAAGGSP